MRSQLIAQELGQRLVPMSTTAIDNVRELEALASEHEQIPIHTDHVLHAGVYARTIHIPAGTVLTGALIKIATLLIVSGDCLVYVGDDHPLHLVGHNVIPASAGRKQAFYANSAASLTMLFADNRETCPTDELADIRELEDMFTDEADKLMSRSHPLSNTITITGE